MAGSIPWLMVVIAVLIVLLAVVYFLVNKGKKRPLDYYNLFIIGIIWLPFGIIMKNSFFFIMGLVLMGLGLAHKDKWKANRRRWKDLGKKERNVVMWITVILTLLLVAGVVAFLLISRELI